MPVSLTSPDTGNLYLGKGIAYFKISGEADYRDMGNIPEIELTPEIEELEHFTSRTGVRTKDLTVVLEKSGTVRWVMEEWTPANLQLFFLGGTIDENAQGGPVFDILSSDAVSGAWKFIGANAQGPQYLVELYNVRVVPNAGLNLIGEEWGTIEVNGEMLLDSVTGKVGICQLRNLPSDT